MNGNNNTERTDSVVVTTIADHLTDNTSGGTAGDGDLTPQPPKLLNVGTPEAAAPQPVYIRGNDESRPSSPSALPGLPGVGVAPVTAGSDGAVPTAMSAGNGTRHLIKHQLNEAQRVAALEHF